MDNFLKITIIVLITIILGLYMQKQCREISVVLILVSVCTVLLFAFSSFIEPVFEFIDNVRSIGSINQNAVTTLIKASGIGLISEITALLCADAGFGSLGKVLQITSIFAILLISIPIFNELISLITKVLMP